MKSSVIGRTNVVARLKGGKRKMRRPRLSLERKQGTNDSAKEFGAFASEDVENLAIIRPLLLL